MGQASPPVIDARSATITKLHRSPGDARELILKHGRHFSEFPDLGLEALRASMTGRDACPTIFQLTSMLPEV